MLEARGITYAYPGAARALYQGFDLAVAPDERVALCAPSGFGKTTLCRLLAGYERPQAGEVLVDGEPLPRRGACPVQMIWQHPEAAVDPRMRMGATLAEAGEVPGRLLDDLGIQKRWLSRYPHELSGGELQRFCIAREPALPRGRRGVHHARRPHAGPDMALPHGRDEQAGHRARVRVAFPRPHRPHSHARRAPGRVGPDAFPGLSRLPRLPPCPIRRPSSLPAFCSIRDICN